MNTSWRKCKNCGSDFAFTTGRGIFCSVKCYNEHRKTHPEEYRQVTYHTLKCDACGKIFQRRAHEDRGIKKYCSKHCAGTVTGGMAKRGEPRISALVPCAQCGKPFKQHISGKGKFCNRACYLINKTETISGEGNPNYRHGKNRVAGQYIARKFFEMKCIICGFDFCVDIHHIKPISEGGVNSPDNLAVLCPNHHRMAQKGAIKSELLIKKVAELIAKR